MNTEVTEQTASLQGFYSYGALAEAFGWNYGQAYRFAQQFPWLGFMVGKRRFFTKEEVSVMKERLASFRNQQLERTKQ
jgi:hypothetical protein